MMFFRSNLSVSQCVSWFGKTVLTREWINFYFILMMFGEQEVGEERDGGEDQVFGSLTGEWKSAKKVYLTQEDSKHIPLPLSIPHPYIFLAVTFCLWECFSPVSSCVSSSMSSSPATQNKNERKMTSVVDCDAKACLVYFICLCRSSFPS